MRYLHHQRERGQNEKGFTLVELAIVLVIIGLIVGGVLVGQDLIKAAEIRATVGQVEKYDAAVNTFRTKYNAMPGDIAGPATYGLDADGAAGGTGTANGNRLIETSGSTANGLAGESRMFWVHLSQAGMIDGSIDAANAGSTYAAATGIAAVGDANLPQAKIGKGNRFHVTNISGLHNYVLSNITAATATTGAITAASALTPQEAFQLDTKLDDANAATGKVAAVTAATPGTLAGGAASPAAGDCYDSDDGAYNQATAGATANNCQLRIRASF